MAGLTVNWKTHAYSLPSIPASSSFKILIPLNQTQVGTLSAPAGYQCEIPAASYCDLDADSLSLGLQCVHL